MLIVAMAFTTIGCNTKKQDDNKLSEAVTQETTNNESSEAVADETADSEQPEAVAEETTDNEKLETVAERAINNGQSEVAKEENVESEVQVLGEGQTMFLFTITDKDGNETYFEIHTDKETVGEALLDLELIDGEEGEFGLYVKNVNGITADYDVDQTYWAFYIDGEYAMSGVDTTTIEEGKTYAFKVEK